ncbi:FHA domain-containing protein [Calothrix sp. 336/3]|uniref:FHA domain-containing protein n=1 Tax=Calothrix sp. 336/3 TaxID=1337936 RepID=UPI0004E3096E|nr:FHA domain-containing protein [Calothrix sp. 336/3]AKG19934.1 hypothetical protein IJ00_00115 [Calothrix sp. 336/3]
MTNSQIFLSWHDPTTGEKRQPTLKIPVAFGREFAAMPGMIADRVVTRIVLADDQVSRYHALIEWEQNQHVVIDNNSTNGIFINGQRQTRCILENGDRLQIGPYNMTVTLGTSNSATVPPGNPQGIIHPVATPNPQSIISFNPDTNLPDPRLSPSPVTPIHSNFPPPIFHQPIVAVQSLHATGLRVTEIDYLAIGAGLGSFIWVDLLRISGVRCQQIMALGLEKTPYARYQSLCQNSQIPSHERLRSNSDSCPDNIWGFPSYAWREAWHDFIKGHVDYSFKTLWQVFAEPSFAETYTPKAGNVFASIDREAKRIGWEQIFHYGRVRAIRKTDDGRYCIAYALGQGNHAFVVSRYVHLATGYPAIQFLPDLQAYRETYQDFKTVVNAYENHDHIYQQLEKQGGKILIRGRGIVASRIVQRIFEARQKNRDITVLHLMRSPKPEGNKFDKAQRSVKNHYELQPFNWPKACWGGDLRKMLEKASPEERKVLLSQWGGTTTADRHDWQQIAQKALQEGWYQITFGEVVKVERDSYNHPITHIQGQSFGTLTLETDFIIDATGLDAKVEASPLLVDLVKHYHLPLNHLGRFAVANNFELPEMRSGNGQLYAAGAITLGGPYAAVDSFLGLQYAALCAVDSLAKNRAPGIKRLNCLNSLIQWWKWLQNQSPS